MTDASPSGSERVGKRLIVAAIGMVGGVYVAFPAALAGRALARPRRERLGPPPAGPVTVLIVAHNEADAITHKLDDVAGLGRPVETIVASDGSIDATVELARQHASCPTVLDLPRRGKAAALNAGVAVASGDIIVFTDANSRFDARSFEALLAPFSDPEVGGVAGDQRYDARAAGTATGERDY